MPADLIPSLIAAALAALLVGGMLIWALRRMGGGSVRLDDELATLREAKAQAERMLAAEERTAARVPELERSLAEQSRQIDQLKDGRAAIERELATAREALSQTGRSFQESRLKVSQLDAELAQARAEVADLTASLSGLRESLDQERRQSQEKLALLQQARDAMGKEFKVLAEEVMTRHGQAFTRQNKEQVEGILAPLREKMAEFQQGLQAAHTESSKDRARLAEQIRQLSEQSARMSTETHNLTRALKGEAQTQGAWGELILETILERSGLREGQEYVTQESRTAEDGSRLRPDVIVNLPNNQRIVVDSKVSLTAFEAYVNAEDDATRAACLARHLQSMRTHIRTLAGKDYLSVSGSQLDYVVMFVPIEGALAAALQDDPALTGFAAENNVAIATPTTLMIALRTVANVWQVERRNRNAEQIASSAGALYDKFNGFVLDMQKLDTQLGTVRGTYDEAMKKLSTGQGNLVRRVEKLRRMGAKTSKALPPALLDGALAGDDDEEGA